MSLRGLARVEVEPRRELGLKRFRLVVKGSMDQAVQAATNHGAQDIVLVSEEKSDTLLDVRATEGLIAGWFMEEPLPPYPAGTLLLYRESARA